MALEIRQQLKLSQQLVMTPQLQQAIKLLQLSRMELMDVVREELEENPVLEEGQEAPDEKTTTEEELTAEKPDEPVQETVQEVEGDRDGMADIDWKTYLESYSLGGSTADSYEDDEDRPSYENLLTKKPSLSDHLLWQLNLSRLESQERAIAEEIIGNIDDDGYLQVSIEELSSQVNCDFEHAEQVLVAVQSFDPPGVASRNLQECLLKQLEQLEMSEDISAVILREHLDELENRRYQVIARSLQVSLDDVFGAAKFISTLDPRPGSQYGQEDVHYIIPDIFVYKISDEYIVVLNDEGLPNLRINSCRPQKQPPATMAMPSLETSVLCVKDPWMKRI